MANKIKKVECYIDEDELAIFISSDGDVEVHVGADKLIINDASPECVKHTLESLRNLCTAALEGLK